MKFVQLFIIIFALQIAVNAQKITVYLAGDSTMAEKKADKRPETGWGEYLQINFDEIRVKVENHAQNGRSTKSFINEGRWQKIAEKLKKGDYVFIQFGHNDQKLDKPETGAAANGEYRNNLIRFVNEVRAKKANPVLLTPVMRRRFNEKGEFYDTHGEYPDAVRKVATELKVPLLDLHRKTEILLKKCGAEESKKLFLQLKEGENPNYPRGVEDNTHFNQKGASEIAKLAVEEIRASNIKLKKYLKK